MLLVWQLNETTLLTPGYGLRNARDLYGELEGVENVCVGQCCDNFKECFHSAPEC